MSKLNQSEQGRPAARATATHHLLLVLRDAGAVREAPRQRLLDGQLTGYGLGWNVMPLAGRPAISHSGSQQGARTLLVLYPEANLTIVVLANSDHAVVNDFASAILKALETPSSA